MAALLSMLTGGVLLASVGVRSLQDLPLIRAVGNDPFAVALLVTEAVPLGIAAVLGVAAALIAKRNWSGRVGNQMPALIVFGLIVLFGLFLAIRTYVEVVGWILVLLSGAALITQLLLRRQRIESDIPNAA